MYPYGLRRRRWAIFTKPMYQVSGENIFTFRSYAPDISPIAEIAFLLSELFSPARCVPGNTNHHTPSGSSSPLAPGPISPSDMITMCIGTKTQ
jgi:hypothetical protein